MKQSHRYVSALLLFILAATPSMKAQVSLSPTALYVTDQTNVASLYISNSSQDPQEISVSFEFAYPGSDGDGNMVTVSNDSVCAAKFGLTANAKAFPRQFVLQPGKQQTVRVQVRPMNGKPDGMYWTRVIVSSQSAAQNLEETKTPEGIGTKINYLFKQNIPAFYVKGKVSTALVTGPVKTSVENDKLVVVSDLTPAGNAPYNGSVTARLTDGSGKEMASVQQTVVAYFNVKRRVELTLPGGGLLPGTYSLEMTYETKRADISPTDLVQAQPVQKIVPVVIK